MRNPIKSAAAAMSVTAIAVAALAACSPAASDSGTTAAADAGAHASASADAPAPGLWRMTTTTSMPGAPAMPANEVCVTATQASFEAPADAGATGADCQTRPMTRDGAALVGGATCNLPTGGTSTTEIRVEGDFATNYTMTTTVSMDPAPAPGLESMTTTVTAERIGDCAA